MSRSKFLFAVLMAVLLFSACSPAVYPNTEGRSCYKFDFGVSPTDSRNYSINLIDGEWISVAGLSTIDGLLRANWTEAFIIDPEAIEIQVLRKAGSTGDINVSFKAEVFSVKLEAYNITLTADTSVYVANILDNTPTEGNANANITIESSKDIILNYIKVYNKGANPFSRNDCLVVTPTPSPTKTHTPPPQTWSPPTSTPITPTKTITPIPPTSTYTLVPSATWTANPNWCRVWDFSSGAFGWNIIAGTAAGDGYTSTYHYPGQNAYRVVEITQNFTGTIVRADVEFLYSAGHRDSTGDSAFLISANNFTNQLIRINVPTIPGSPQVWTGSQAVSTNVRLLLIAGARAYSSADPGGSGTIKKITLRGTGSNPFGSNNCDLPPTPIPSSTPVPPTITPIPPTATLTRTPLLNGTSINTPTRTPTDLSVTTRTPLPTNIPPTAPPIVPTLPPATFPTLPNTVEPPTGTPPPTSTYIPAPTEMWGSVTPWGTMVGPELTPLPGTPGPQNSIVTPVMGTLVGTPQPGTTTIPVPDSMAGMEPIISGGLGTAVAFANQMPSDITVMMPGLGGLPTYTGYAKWVLSGVSLQELFGQTLYPIPLHIFYGLTAMIFVSTIMFTFRLMMWFFKLIAWVVGKIPFI